ncbi:MAG: DUF998 domain-containing protein [Candidatus Heimdallarchaeota archaeon]|nr:DUF998 domain-containing protein [Candidatus Heimdallarchaeota archaeon]
MNILQILAICGMLAPIIYTVMWILGGIMLDEYSHIRDDVSSLYAVGAPKRWLFQILMILSSVLLLAFSIGLHWGINNGEGSIIGPILFIISAFLGVIVASFFPLDEGGELVTLRGKMHLILIVLSGIICIASMVILWLLTKSLEGWIGFAWFSFASAIVALILVAISGIFAGGEHMGLVERFMVSYYQIYYFVISLMMFINN